MQTETYILVKTFCISHNVEEAFINQLKENDLVEIIIREEEAYLSEEATRQAEQLMRLHNDLHINIEGMEAVLYLLEKIKQKEERLMALQNRLSFYE